MYNIVNKKDVITKINKGAELFIVDIPTLRVINCNDLTIQAIKSFIEKNDTFFVEKSLLDEEEK